MRVAAEERVGRRRAYLHGGLAKSPSTLQSPSTLHIHKSSSRYGRICVWREVPSLPARDAFCPHSREVQEPMTMFRTHQHRKTVSTYLFWVAA